MGLFDGTALQRPVLCSRCNADVKTCLCPPVEIQEPEVEPASQRLNVRVEKRKRGKVVTVVSGFGGSAAQRQQILTKLKNHCGAGGSMDENNLEIQGDHQTRVRGFLQAAGFKLLGKA